MWLGLVWGYGPLSFLHPFQGPLRLAPQSFTYNLKLRDWRRIEVENFDAFIYFTWFLDFSLFPSFYKFPNIQGVFKYIYSFGDDWSGAFRNKTGGAAVCGVDEPSTSSMNLYELKMGFEASASSSIFGTSVTVQTASLRALSLIRAY